MLSNRVVDRLCSLPPLLLYLFLILAKPTEAQVDVSTQADPQGCTNSPPCATSIAQIIRVCRQPEEQQSAAQPSPDYPDAEFPFCASDCRDAILDFLENFNCGPETTFSLFFQPERFDPRVVSAFILCGYAIGRHYPFMCQNSVDWPQSYWNMRHTVSLYTDITILYDIFTQSLRPIVDAGINILQFDITEDPPDLDGMYRGGNLPQWVGAPPPLWLDLIDGSYLSNVNRLMDGVLSFGILSRTPYLGYIRINSFSSSDRPWFNAWDRIAYALSGSRGLIIDVRFNQGGDDVSAASVASRFTSNTTVGITRKTRIPSYFTGCCRFDYRPSQSLCLHPIWPNFVGKEIVVLTSTATLGAAESFVMMMRGLPGCRITIIGEKTQGAPSDELFMRLPNGWLGAFPHKVYSNREGRVYQGRGIPPDIIVALEAENYANGIDRILNRAIDYLATNNPRLCKSC